MNETKGVLAKRAAELDRTNRSFIITSHVETRILHLCLAYMCTILPKHLFVLSQRASVQLHHASTSVQPFLPFTGSGITPPESSPMSNPDLQNRQSFVFLLPRYAVQASAITQSLVDRYFLPFFFAFAGSGIAPKIESNVVLALTLCAGVRGLSSELGMLPSGVTPVGNGKASSPSPKLECRLFELLWLL